MRYKIERFKDAKHLESSQRDPRIRPYQTNERSFDSRQKLIQQLEQERMEARAGGVYRVTPLDRAFLVEVAFEATTTAWVHDDV